MTSRFHLTESVPYWATTYTDFTAQAVVLQREYHETTHETASAIPRRHKELTMVNAESACRVLGQNDQPTIL
jgi:hypothetical protein